MEHAPAPASQHWDIERSQGLCDRCGEALPPDRPGVSALYAGQGPSSGTPPEPSPGGRGGTGAGAGGLGFVRRDYCEPCFNALADRPFSYWRRAPEKKARGAGGAAALASEGGPSAAAAKLEALLDLFLRLGGAEADHEKKLRYLLALALVRRRKVELVDLAREGGADVLVLRASGRADLLTVPAPLLSPQDLERLGRELEEEVGL